MVVGMSFSMLAPFQFVAHRWTILVMRVELVLFSGTAVLASLAYGWRVLPAGAAGALIGLLVTVGAVLLLVGSLPVIYYDKLNASRFAIP
jgi:hypothetical protein